MAAETARSADVSVIHPVENPALTGPRGESLAERTGERGVPPIRESSDRQKHLETIGLKRDADPREATQAITTMLRWDEPPKGVLIVGEWPIGYLSSGEPFVRKNGLSLVTSKNNYAIHALFTDESDDIAVVSSSRYGVATALPGMDRVVMYTQAKLTEDEVQAMKEGDTRIYAVDELVSLQGEWRPEPLVTYHTRFVAAIAEMDERLATASMDLNYWEKMRARSRLVEEYLGLAGLSPEMHEFFRVGFNADGKAETLILPSVREIDPAKRIVDPRKPPQVEKTGEVLTIPIGDIMWYENCKHAVDAQRFIK